MFKQNEKLILTTKTNKFTKNENHKHVRTKTSPVYTYTQPLKNCQQALVILYCIVLIFTGKLVYIHDVHKLIYRKCLL